jgi:TfoX/Sxy family transcriptional regulator of competence genes
MATQQRTIDYLIEQATSADTVSAKSMFGEYCVYVDGKMIGSVCDDKLYLKPTASGRVNAEPISDAPPYLGAKPQMLIEAGRWRMAGELLRVTASELPTPKSRKPKPLCKLSRRQRPTNGHSRSPFSFPTSDLR